MCAQNGLGGGKFTIEGFRGCEEEEAGGAGGQVKEEERGS